MFKNTKNKRLKLNLMKITKLTNNGTHSSKKLEKK